MRDLNVNSLPVAFRRSNRCRLALAILVVLGGIASDSNSWGQPPMGPRRGGPQAPGGSMPPGSMPPGSMPPGSMPPGNMGGGRSPTGRPIPGQGTGVPKGQPSELKIDSTTLPDGYAPPMEKDPLMEIDQPIALPDEISKLSKDIGKYQTTLRTARSSDADKALIRSGIRFRLAQMCLKKNRMDLLKLRDDLLREINGAGSAPDNPKTVREFRQMVLTELLNQAAPLLETQNLYVRMHIAMLLGQLDITEDNPRLGTKQEAFAPAFAPLVKVLNDPAQHEAVKIPAANGLVRILKLGTPPIQDRTKIAAALVSELKNKKAHPWYQMRLVGGLAYIDVDLDQQKQPFVVDILKAILADNGRTWQVRSGAAYALGRVPLPQACNPPSVPIAIAQYVLELAKAAQKDPQKNERDPKWKMEFFKVYLAFQQQDKDDLMADKRSKAGLLNNQQALARPAYTVIVPMTAAIYNGQRLTDQQYQALEAFLNPNLKSDTGTTKQARSGP